MLALTALSCSAALASTGIVNSKHNMSSSSTSGVKSDNTQICIYCHTPHAAFKPSEAAGSSAIWNHTLSSATYVLRSGESQSDFQPNATTNNAGTALCLSCHDGTVALNSLHNTTSTGTITFSGSDVGPDGKLGDNLFNLGTDFTDDHPIEVALDTSYTNLTNFDGSAGMMYVQGSTSGDAAKVFRESGRTGWFIQCASCHEVHNMKGYKSLLRIDNTQQSKLCLACHVK